jgi:hypothetical protein
VISNATVTAIAFPIPADAEGTIAYGADVALAIRVALAEPTSGHVFTMGALLTDVTSVLYVLKSALPAGLVPSVGCRVAVTIDGGASQILFASIVKNRQKAGGLAHYEVFLKERA